jgi:hypothetical protein
MFSDFVRTSNVRPGVLQEDVLGGVQTQVACCLACIDNADFQSPITFQYSVKSAMTPMMQANPISVLLGLGLGKLLLIETSVAGTRRRGVAGSVIRNLLRIS